MAIFTLPIARVGDDNFRVGSGYKLHFYEAGTSTDKDTYTDNTYTTPLANPVVADGNGRFSVIWTSGDYKVVLKTDADVTVWTVDNYTTDTGSTTYAEGVLSAVGSAADVITADLPTAPGSLVDQQQVVVELQHAANTTTTPTFNLNSLGAKTIKRDDNAALRIGDTGGDGAKIYLSYSSTNDVWILLNPSNPPVSADVVGVSSNYIDGLKITNNSSTPLTKIDVALGERIDSTGAFLLSLTSGLTKQIDNTFAEGDDAGGFSDAGTGATASTNTWYRIFLISKADGTSDIIFSDTQANALLDDVAAAAGYIYANRIGWFRTDGSTQVIDWSLGNGRRYIHNTPVNASISPTTGVTSFTVRCPPSQLIEMVYTIRTQASAVTAVEGYGILTQTDQDNTTPSTTLHTAAASITASGAGNLTLINKASNTARLKCNASSQIRHRETTNVDAVDAISIAWEDDLSIA